MSDWSERFDKAYIKSLVLLSASENSITSIPSPVYLRKVRKQIEIIGRRLHQCKKARRLNMAVNLIAYWVGKQCTIRWTDTLCSPLENLLDGSRVRERSCRLSHEWAQGILQGVEHALKTGQRGEQTPEIQIHYQESIYQGESVIKRGQWYYEAQAYSTNWRDPFVCRSRTETCNQHQRCSVAGALETYFGLVINKCHQVLCILKRDTYFARRNLSAKDGRCSKVAAGKCIEIHSWYKLWHWMTYPLRGSQATSKFLRSNNLNMTC
jgi:hypothetical protein